MMRRPSILASSTYAESGNSSQALQREIQTLRRKTQEAMAVNCDRIAHLEEDIEIKQLRIEEIEKEIAELEEEQDFGSVPSLKHFDSNGVNDNRHQRPARSNPWSLAFGVGSSSSASPSTSKDDPQKPGQQNEKSFSDLNAAIMAGRGDSGPTAPAPPILRNPERRPSILNFYQPVVSQNANYSSSGGGGPSISGGINIFALQKGHDKKKEEEDLMKKLKECEQQNKAIIEKHENDLKFKSMEVTALRKTAESQAIQMDVLNKDIAKRRKEEERRRLLMGVEDDEDECDSFSVKTEARVSETLEEHTRRLEELQSSLDALRRIQSISDKNIVEEMPDLRTRVEEARRNRDASEEVREKELEVHRKRLLTGLIHVALIKKVTERAISRMETKARDGNAAKVITIAERAAQALQEERWMRQDDSARTAYLCGGATEDVEKLAYSVLLCSREFTEAVSRVRGMALSEEIAMQLVSTLEIVNDSTSFVKICVDFTFEVIAEMKESYDLDSELLSTEVQEELNDTAHSICYEGEEASSRSLFTDFEDDETVTTSQQQKTLFRQESELESLQAAENDLASRIQELRGQLENFEQEGEAEQNKVVLTKEGETKEKLDSRSSELVAALEEGGRQWAEKDLEIAKVLQRAEKMKHREDMLRKLLENATKLDGEQKR